MIVSFFGVILSLFGPYRALFGLGWGSKKFSGGYLYRQAIFFSNYGLIQTLSCSFECLVVGGLWCFQQLLSLNLTTVLVVLLLGLWVLLAYGKTNIRVYIYIMYLQQTYSLQTYKPTNEKDTKPIIG